MKPRAVSVSGERWSVSFFSLSSCISQNVTRINKHDYKIHVFFAAAAATGTGRAFKVIPVTVIAAAAIANVC